MLSDYCMSDWSVGGKKEVILRINLTSLVIFFLFCAANQQCLIHQLLSNRGEEANGIGRGNFLKC